MLPVARQLDSRVEIITPENIAFQYRLAGPFQRLPAYLIDAVIKIVASVAVLLAFSLAGGMVGAAGVGIGMTLVAWFLLSWFYGGLFETFWNGQTPGKRLLGLRVVTVDGQPINALQAVLRNVLRAADAMPVVPWPGLELPVPIVPLYLVGLASAMYSQRFQRLADLACGTIVVVEQRQRTHGIVRIDEPEVIELAALLPAKCVVERKLAQALAMYVERRRRLGVIRRAEIASALGEPLRQRYELPASTNADTLLCALYYRAFVADRANLEPRAVRAAPRADASRQPLVSTGGKG